MKILVVLLLAGLCCSVTEGWRVASCDVFWHLKTFLGNITVTANHKVLNGDDLLAQLLCYVVNSSNFDDRAVNQMIIETEDHHSGEHGPPKRPHGRWRRHNKRPCQTGPKPPSHHPQPHEDKEVWTFYGIYQLGNRLVCNDSVTPSLNICGLECSQLLNSDLRIATQCLTKILTYIQPGSEQQPTEELKTMVKLLFKDQCSFEANYFYCPLP
ncbi:Lysozyme C [Channa argus]|uniref:Lysozyme C n=1 Tax=Channa argus TaxID=215402 RepID=A0A6G1PCQ9_CHAAH|nr:Lysozyme C [Channa argus]